MPFFSEFMHDLSEALLSKTPQKPVISVSLTQCYSTQHSSISYFLYSSGETGLCLIPSTASYLWRAGIFSVCCALSIITEVIRAVYRTFQIVELANVYSKWLLIPKEIPSGFELVLCHLPCMLIFCCACFFWQGYAKHLCQWNLGEKCHRI